MARAARCRLKLGSGVLQRRQFVTPRRQLALGLGAAVQRRARLDAFGANLV
jgi:hypothetical protein